jgi:hypothetical protein
MEARRDFEEALSKLKGGRRKRDADSDSVVINSAKVTLFITNIILEL